MLAKIIVTGATRDEALAQAAGRRSTRPRSAGSRPISTIFGNSRASTSSPSGEMLTRTLQTFAYRPNTIEVLAPGTQTTVQDWPGRLGYWAVGVPPSGPMDPLSFRLANRLVGNDGGRGRLEITLSGPTLRFNSDTVICLGGAELAATLDGEPVPLLAGVRRQGRAGAEARQRRRDRACAPISPCAAASMCRLSRQPLDLHARQVRRPRRAHAADRRCAAPRRRIGRRRRKPPRSPPSLKPRLTHEWEIGVLYGPHGAPDFFTPDDIETFFAADWEVHYNSNPTGVRLIGPKPNLGARRRRRGGAASVQHPRQRLRHRHDRFHRRHAGHPRARRSVARRLRLPGDHRAGRALEDGPASPRRQSALHAPRAGGGRAASGEAGRGDRSARSRCLHRRRRTPSVGADDCIVGVSARRPTTSRASPIAAPATPISSSNTARSSSISSCASACMR